MLRHTRIIWAQVLATGAALLLLTPGAPAQSAGALTGGERAMQETILQWGYVHSQYGVQNPPDILGGPLRITVRQDGGSVRVILPGSRQASEPITSVPDLSQGRFTLQAIDATATDAARTRDTVNFQASWNDPQGNTYAVRCNRVMSRGIGYPVFGGVVTNHVLYSLNGRGVPALPAGFTYVAFWGTGDAWKNGRVVGRSIAVQAALVDTAGQEGYPPVREGPAPRREFHVLMLPTSPAPSENTAAQRNVSTGKMFLKGREQPCWQVVFDNPQAAATWTPSTRPTRFIGRSPGEPGVAQGAPGAAAVVEMTDALRYVPGDIKIAVGQTVEWRNASHVVHTVTCDPSFATNPRDVQLPEGAEPFNSGTIMPGAVFGYTFKTPGVYKYFCIPHEYAGMVGTVEVIGQP